MSETENIRKNLAIERMIIEGCDILLDVNQMFVRQGTLIQNLPGPKGSRLPALVHVASRGETSNTSKDRMYRRSTALIVLVIQ